MTTHALPYLVLTLAMSFNAYGESPPPNTAPPPNTQLHPSHVKTLAASCAACHGSQGNSVGITPMLAGLNKGYFVTQMLAFKQDKQPSTVMHRHAKGLTEGEIQLLADYFSKQPRATMHALQPQPLGAAHD